MNIFPFLHFFAAIVYFFLAVYIILKNPKALINRVCSLFIFSLGVWCVGMIFAHNPYVSKATAGLFLNLGAFGWGTFSSLFVWFILIFTGKREVLKKKWVTAVLVGIPVSIIVMQFSGVLYGQFSRVYFGWKSHLNHSIWSVFFSIGYLSLLGTGLYFNIDFMRKTTNAVSRKQAAIITVTIIVTLILATFTDVVCPALHFDNVPNVGNIIALIWAFGMVYAMVKYKFLEISLATAADNIISTMFGSLILLNMEGEIVTVNKAVVNLSGYKEDELIGAPVGMLFTKEDLGDGLDKSIVSEEGVKNMEIVLKAKAGKEIPMLFSSSVLRDEAGTAGGIVCVAKDITAHKQLEEEVFKRKKLESIETLAGGIAHDYNNLLSVILGNITMAREEVTPGGTVDKFLANMEDVSLKTAELTKKFITFSRWGWMKKTELTLSGILKNMKERGLPITSYDIDIPADLAPIHGDEEQLSEVLLNLFLNSVEAMPGYGGGCVSVRAENTKIEPQNKLLLKDGIYVKVSIEDNGAGIPPEIIEKVFDPYFSTKDNVTEKGLGLGLTTCYSIIKKHEGHITIKSPAKEGKGTVVTLYLPAPRKVEP